MALKQGERILTDRGVYWDESGNPYYLTNLNNKNYVPPAAVGPYSDQRLQEWAKRGGGGSGKQWDSQKGKFDTGVNWNNVLVAGVGGLLAAPAVGALMGGAGASGAGGAGAAAPGAGGVLPGLSGAQVGAANAAVNGIPTAAGGFGGAAAAAAPSLVGRLTGDGFLGSAVRQGAGLAGNYFAGRSQANALRDASALEQSYMDRALAAAQENQTWNRGQYTDYLGRLGGFREGIGGRTSGGGGGMVTLEAPTGERQQVPATQAEHYISLGARRID